VAETVATDPELKKEQKNDQPEAAAGVVNEDGPAKVVSAAGPADPASGSGSDEKASSLPAASPPSDASSKGFTENDPAPSHAVSSSTPPEVQRGASSEVSSPSTSAVPLAEIASPKAAKADPASATEDQIPNEAIKEEVIRRINALPKVAPEKKANLIEKMHKARSMERLCVVPFEKGQTALRKVAAGELVKTFAGPSMLAKLSDPTMILVVAGYADLGGRAEQNFRFSQERAENVSKILKEQANLFNAMQVIGMGGTEILDSKRPDQNRAVEVWSVVPL
jgi:outer membrane protein OmpA-like peptidoglycan-associated protein